MSDGLITALVAIGVVALCFIIMAVGLLRGKTFTSCGCASVTINGEEIKCPACPAVPSRSFQRRLEFAEEGCPDKDEADVTACQRKAGQDNAS